MNTQPIQVRVIEAHIDYITVKLPFLDIPVQMNHELFRNRINSGYFTVMDDWEQHPKIAS